MKYFLLLFILPLLAIAQEQDQKLNFYRNDYLPDAKILLKDSINIYFKKTSHADTVFKIPISDVSANLKGIPTVSYTDWNDALLKFNKDNATGIGLQLSGIGISLIGYGILVAAVTHPDDSNQTLYKTGGYIAVAGGALSLVGLALEFGSHRHLKRMNVIAKAIPYP